MGNLENALYNYRGRRELWTDVPEITAENVIMVLQRVQPYFTNNFADCQFLLDFDAGIQPLRRKEPKKFRPDIDFECVDNVAHEGIEFWKGFGWGFPITLVQRGEKDSGEANEDEIKAISMLNEMFAAEMIDSKTQNLGYKTEVTGIGYSIIDINMDYEDGDSLFKYEILDPRTTFVIRSSRYLDKRIMLGVTFREDFEGNIHFTCFSKDRRYEIINGYQIVNGTKSSDRSVWDHGDRSGEPNPLGMVPIVEWFLSYDRQGRFERQIDEINNLNLLISDFTNDVDQNTQAVWHTNDVDFPEDEVTNSDGTITVEEKKPGSGDWISTYTSPDGKTPFIKPLTLDYDYQGILGNIQYRRSLILQKMNVPQGNSEMSNSTGIAINYAGGWAAAETVANGEQSIKEGCRLQEVKIALAAIKRNPNTPADSPLLKLRMADVKPVAKRNKNFELSTKTAALSNLISAGIDGRSSIETVNLFTDSNQVWADSKDLIKKHQDKLFGEERKLETINENKVIEDSGDPKFQTNNSPNVDGNKIDNTPSDNKE